MAGPHALLWSGGKDCTLALRRAAAAGLEIGRLLSFYDAATGRVRFHATTVAMLEAQSEQLGIELRAVGTSWSEMERRLLEALAELRTEGFTGVVVGDIHLADVRAWYEERVIASRLEHVEPIWGTPSADLLAEFVEGGGRAVVTCVDLSRLDRSWLGRVIDQHFVEEIGVTGIDACGENGEYHSFAFEGPPFHQAVAWRPGQTHFEPGFAQLDLLARED